MSLAQEIADQLLGSCYDLGEVITYAQSEDVALLAELDQLVMRCDTCGWWVETDEVDDDSNCEDCQQC